MQFLRFILHRLPHIIFAVCCSATVLLLSAFSGAEMAYILHWGANDTTQAQQAEEEELQAVIIWQFLQFIEFPPLIAQAAFGTVGSGSSSASTSQQEPFVIGIVGTSRVESFLLEKVRKKRLQDGRSLEVRRIANLDDVSRCQTVFVAPGESARLAQVLAKTRGKSILTIGRDENFLARGGLVNFYVENSRLRFEYNPDEISASKLRFSSKILRLGKQYSAKTKD
jgi:hypothetical protein